MFGADASFITRIIRLSSGRVAIALGLVILGDSLLTLSFDGWVGLHVEKLIIFTWAIFALTIIWCVLSIFPAIPPMFKKVVNFLVTLVGGLTFVGAGGIILLSRFGDLSSFLTWESYLDSRFWSIVGVLVFLGGIVILSRINWANFFAGLGAIIKFIVIHLIALLLFVGGIVYVAYSDRVDYFAALRQKRALNKG